MKTWIFALIVGLNAPQVAGQPLDQPAWKVFVEHADRYELVGGPVRCPIESASYNGDLLEVSYTCHGPEGQRTGVLQLRQVGRESFRGRYVLSSRFGNSNGTLRVRFLPNQRVQISSRDQQLTMEVQALADADF